MFAPSPFDHAVFGHFFQDSFQPNAVIALKMKGPRNFPFRDRVVMLSDEIKNVLFAGAMGLFAHDLFCLTSGAFRFIGVLFNQLECTFQRHSHDIIIFFE